MIGIRPLRLALFGGGPGSFIGAVHKMAAELDGRFKVVAGAFSRDAIRSAEQGRVWGIDPDRVHTNPHDLIAAEKGRSDPVDAVAIATPNDSHLAIASAAAAAGIPVICDKPMTATLGEARRLAGLIDAGGAPYALTYTYTGYAMIREARARIAAGAIGAVRKIAVDYSQGWLAAAVEANNKQASWRTDPEQAGIGGCIGDIGVHAFQLAEYVSGQRVTELCADLSRVVAGRALDDDCNILLRFGRDVAGALSASQIATGERNSLRLRVYGELGGIEWSHDHPDRLTIRWADGRSELLFAGATGVSSIAVAATRLPAGHPEGFIEAFATIYRDFADVVAGSGDRLDGTLPGLSDGVRSMMFVEAAVRSSRERRWASIDGDML